LLAISWTDKSGNFWLFGGAGADSTTTSTDLNDLWKFDGNNWTWVSGSDVGDQAGVYGTKGTAAPSNVPGGRWSAVSWADGSGNLWLFGGAGLDSTGLQGGLNDLWKFDGSNWTWVSGSNVGRQSGVYGTQGTASPSNIPGGRLGFVSWSDKKGNLWLFGGGGYDSTGTFGFLNDLWQFEP
jgi:N-acetylneuraminic acid mutarotase